MMVIKQLLHWPWNWAGCNCGALYHSELFPGKEKKVQIVAEVFFLGKRNASLVPLFCSSLGLCFLTR